MHHPFDNAEGATTPSALPDEPADVDAARSLDSFYVVRGGSFDHPRIEVPVRSSQ